MISLRLSKKITGALLLLLCLGTVVQAAPRLPGFFTRYMVLQRDKPVPIWGWADAGEVVTVKFGEQAVSATTGEDGRWSLKLNAMPASSEGQSLSVSSDRSPVPFVLKDIVVGDVWICSGQSNMNFVLGNVLNSSVEVDAARYPNIRFIKIACMAADIAFEDVRAAWIRCSPATAKNLTAVGYFFGRKLHTELGVPIGLIHVNWGGTKIEPWTAPEGFRRVKELKQITTLVDASLPTTVVGKAAYRKSLLKIRAWLPQMEQALDSDGDLPAMPSLPRVGVSHQDPTRIYNAMIHPLIPFAIRGAIWYQGESNGGEGFTYFHKTRALIEGWRELWGQGDFPFYFVQLANFQSTTKDPAGGNGWARLREAQVKSLSIRNTGMAVTVDIGNAKDIHPKNKQDVGDRLARWALAKEFGKAVVPSGPLYKSHAVEGETIRVRFDYVGAGLMAGRKEGLTPTAEGAGGTLRQFAIAGADKVWHWAVATIDGDAVVVSSTNVPAPVAVRYAFSMNPEGCNLYNRDGLPASPFRTDTWGVEPKPVEKKVRIEPNWGNNLVLIEGKPVRTADFTQKGNGRPETQKTEASVVLQSGILEFSFTCRDTSISDIYTDYDAIKMWKDDCVAIWIEPEHAHGKGGKRIMIQMSASGAIHDAVNGESRVDLPGIMTAVKKIDIGWTGTVRVPVKSLGGAAPGSVWGFNMTRINQTYPLDYSKSEFLTWASNPSQDDLAVNAWGHLIFSDHELTEDAVQKAIAAPHTEAAAK